MQANRLRTLGFRMLPVDFDCQEVAKQGGSCLRLSLPLPKSVVSFCCHSRSGRRSKIQDSGSPTASMHPLLKHPPPAA